VKKTQGILGVKWLFVGGGGDGNGCSNNLYEFNPKGYNHLLV
jgi:hypothetical protein